MKDLETELSETLTGVEEKEKNDQLCRKKSHLPLPADYFLGNEKRQGGFSWSDGLNRRRRIYMEINISYIYPSFFGIAAQHLKEQLYGSFIYVNVTVQRILGNSKIICNLISGLGDEECTRII